MDEKELLLRLLFILVLPFYLFGGGLWLNLSLHLILLCRGGPDLAILMETAELGNTFNFNSYGKMAECRLSSHKLRCRGPTSRGCGRVRCLLSFLERCILVFRKMNLVRIHLVINLFWQVQNPLIKYIRRVLIIYFLVWDPCNKFWMNEDTQVQWQFMLHRI